jgi:hypothetical protein
MQFAKELRLEIQTQDSSAQLVESKGRLERSLDTSAFLHSVRAGTMPLR